MIGNIDSAFYSYKVAITNIEDSVPDVTSEQILAAFIARDAIEIILLDKDQDTTNYLVEISKLDKILKKHSNLASKFGNLADVRKLLNPSEKSWWWSIESNATSFWDRFDWLWGALTIPWLAVNLSLIA